MIFLKDHRAVSEGDLKGGLEGKVFSVDFYLQIGVLGPHSQLVYVGVGAFKWHTSTK